MRLIFPLLKDPLDLGREDKINILVIENQKYFTHFLKQLWKGVQKQESEIVLSENHVPVDLSKKLETVQNYVPFEINKKTLLTKLYQRAQSVMMNEDFYMMTGEIIEQNVNFLNKVIQTLPFAIDISPDYDISYIMKSVNMRFDSDYDSLSEQLIDYMETVNELEGEKCFALVNLRNYIDDDEIDSFYKSILYKKLCVLVVSANDYTLSKYEHKTIVDRDLCVI